MIDDNNQNNIIQYLLELVSQWCREICDVWISKDNSPPQEKIALDRYLKIIQEYTDPVSYLQTIRNSIKNCEDKHIINILKNIDQRILQFTMWCNDRENYYLFQYEMYEKYGKNIYQLGEKEREIITNKNNSISKIIHPKEKITLSPNEYIQELFLFSKTLFSQLNIEQTKDFFDLSIEYVNWTLGTYRENDKKIYIGNQLKQDESHFFQILAHEFGHHVHYKLTKLYAQKQEFQNGKHFHSKYIDFAIVGSEGFAIYFVEKFTEFIEFKWPEYANNILQQNEYYLKYTIKRAVIAREFFKGIITNKEAIEKLKTITPHPEIQLNNILANPSYQEVYYPGYLYVKKIGLLNLIKEGFIGLEEIRNINYNQIPK